MTCAHHLTAAQVFPPSFSDATVAPKPPTRRYTPPTKSTCCDSNAPSLEILVGLPSKQHVRRPDVTSRIMEQRHAARSAKLRIKLKKLDRLRQTGRREKRKRRNIQATCSVVGVSTFTTQTGNRKRTGGVCCRDLRQPATGCETDTHTHTQRDREADPRLPHSRAGSSPYPTLL